MEGLEGVRDVAAACDDSLAVTQSGTVFSWGRFQHGRADDVLRPSTNEGFGGVHVRRVCAGGREAFAIGDDGELFSWGEGWSFRLGHGDEQDQPSPKRVEALRSVRVSSAAVGLFHALALAEDGLVYAWGENLGRDLLGNPNVEKELLPKPVEALQGVHVASIVAAVNSSYAVTDTGELPAWGRESFMLGHGEQMECPLPKPVHSLRASRWMRWAPVKGTCWRWRMTDACTRGAAPRRHTQVRSVSARQWVVCRSS
jgi:alpha-tubulin suppressor-like RCC1 family protein